MSGYNTVVTGMDFEKTIQEMENKIEGLRRLGDSDGVNITEEVIHLEEKLQKKLKQVYAKLTPWQKTQVARHPLRPHCTDYINYLIDDFTPLAGDRLFAEDKAVIGGLGRFKGRSVVVIGQEKGRDTQTRVEHNFGMARPEGYRKAERLFKLADKFSIPVVTLIDTAGAYPGVDAEERGQGLAISSCIETAFSLEVPVIASVIGEGGSGGAIALAAANKVLMFEHAIYSVISPEGCASILWREREKAKDAANSLKMTAKNLLEMGIIDEIIPEPLGGAHRNHDEASANLGKALQKALDEFDGIAPARIKAMRREKFLKTTR